MTWFVYMIHCSDDTLYTGITNDVRRRFEQHASGRGAKYFLGRRPQQLVYLESGHDRSSAAQREMQLKKLSRQQKTLLIASDGNRISDILIDSASQQAADDHA